MQGIVFRPGDARFEGRSVAEAVDAGARRPRLPDGQPQPGQRDAGPDRRPARGADGRRGYAVEARSHNAVAAAVAQGRADWGVAIAPVAAAYGLGFLPVRAERYDFAIPEARWDRPAVAAFRETARSSRTSATGWRRPGFLAARRREAQVSSGRVVLCGGESRRMGQPKAWLPFGPERMLQRVVRLVGRGGVGPIVVVAAPGQDLPPLPDRGGRRPRPGLAAAARSRGSPPGWRPCRTRSSWPTPSATDVPFLQPAWIERLARPDRRPRPGHPPRRRLSPPARRPLPPGDASCRQSTTCSAATASARSS